MTDDAPAIPPTDSGLETRLRMAMTMKGGGDPVRGADWGDLAGRLASTARRRQQVFAGVAVMALIVGAAGGYFGEAAASPGLSASGARSGAGTPSTTSPGSARALAPSSAGPNSAVMCPGAAGSTSVADIGSATRVFIRTTTGGVTIRVYRSASTDFPCPMSPTPVAGSGSSTNSSSGSTGSSTTGTATAGTSTVQPIIATAPEVSVELSDDDAVGQGSLSPPVCFGSPLRGETGGSGTAGGAGTETTTPPTTKTTTTTTTTSPPAAGATIAEPEQLTTGTFGVQEGDPVWWVAAEVGSDVTSVRMTFPDGSTDQMAPVGGIAVVAGRVTAAVASGGQGPDVVRGTLALLGANGGTVATVTLPQEPAPVPVPGPVPYPVPLRPVPLNGATGSGSPSAIVVCPQSTTIPPNQSTTIPPNQSTTGPAQSTTGPAQSSATTEKR